MDVSDVKACANMLNENVRVVAPDEFVKLIKANLSDQITHFNVINSGDDKMKLEQNFPNPATDNTTIRYYLSSNAKEVTISIYTVNGQLMKEMKAKNQVPGWNEFKLSIQGFRHGTYLYKLKMDGNWGQSPAKLLLVK